jgi:hypothetical protein
MRLSARLEAEEGQMTKGTIEQDQPAIGNAEAGDVLLDPNARDLAWLAETADGIRDKHLLLVMDEQKRLQLRREGKVLRTDTPVAVVKGAKPLRIKTSPLRPSRVPVVAVTCQAENGKAAPLPPVEGEGWTWDAMFWTESAVEKFLYPYYQSQRLLDDQQLKLLKKQFDADNAVAIAHRAPSHSSVVPAATVGIGLLGADRTTVTWTLFSNLLKEQPGQSRTRRSRSNGSRAR